MVLTFGKVSKINYAGSNGFTENMVERKNIRLKGYDYSQPGYYFVTICTKDREILFGEIINGEIKLNDASNMIKKWYLEIQNKFEFVNCGKYVIMPNHFHCIINIVGADQRVCPNNEGEHIVGADQRVCPNNEGEHMVGADQRVCPNNEGEHMVGADLRVCPDNEGEHMVGADLRVCPDNSGDVCYFQNDIHYNEGEHMGSPLHRIVQWFKTMTTNEYIRGVKNYHWKPFPGKLWQRNYYEHIIRNNYELFNVENYIENNPKNWEKDSEN